MYIDIVKTAVEYSLPLLWILRYRIVYKSSIYSVIKSSVIVKIHKMAEISYFFTSYIGLI